ncbi:MAG: ABC transporter substrate-binding protein [Desulfobacula sp.]|nr:ABC transporter substrate-binding protein [Desulfobacula sp.]
MKHNKTSAQRFFWYPVLLLIILVFIPAPLPASEIKTRTITDMADRRVIIKHRVDKIVTTFKPSSLCVLSLGLAHKLVGIDSSSRQDRLFQAVFPEVVNLTGVGSKSMGINFETLVSLKPDLVIFYSQKDGLSFADRLDSINIPCVVIIPETFDTIKESMRVIALAAGEPERTIYVENQMDTVMDLVAQRLSGLVKEDRKTGYFASFKGIYSTATGNMLQDEIFSKAGIENVSRHLRGYFQDISPEQLMKWNPDIMVLSQHMKKSEIKRLSNKALARINAVSQKNVYQCPSSLAPWDFPSPLSVLASLWLAHKVYPERFLDIEFENKVDEFHNNLFGKTLKQMGGNLDDTIY